MDCVGAHLCVRPMCTHTQVRPYKVYGRKERRLLFGSGCFTRRG